MVGLMVRRFLKAKAHGRADGPKIFKGQSPWSDGWSENFFGPKPIDRRMVQKMSSLEDVILIISALIAFKTF